MKQPGNSFRRRQVSEDSIVYAVMVGSKFGAIYRYKEDADAHASVAGGVVVSAPIKDEIPQWVSTMVDSAKEKAKMQSGR